ERSGDPPLKATHDHGQHSRVGGRGMELAECRARELAHRDEGRPRNRETCLQGRAIDSACPRSGLRTHHSRRPTTMANTPEMEDAAWSLRNAGRGSWPTVTRVGRGTARPACRVEPSIQPARGAV